MGRPLFGAARISVIGLNGVSYVAMIWFCGFYSCTNLQHKGLFCQNPSFPSLLPFCVFFSAQKGWKKGTKIGNNSGFWVVLNPGNVLRDLGMFLETLRKCISPSFPFKKASWITKVFKKGQTFFHYIEGKKTKKIANFVSAMALLAFPVPVGPLASIQPPEAPD